MRKLHRGNNEYGCGAGILQVALGGDAFEWQSKILEKRLSTFSRLNKKGKKKYKSIFRDGLADEWSLTEEVVPILEKGLRRSLVFAKATEPISLISLAAVFKPDTTYFVILDEHFCICQNNSVYDNSHYRQRLENYRFRNDTVEAVAVLKNYEVKKPLKPVYQPQNNYYDSF